MIVKHQRPVNLNLASIRFPMTAIVSILHRISGVILFLALPLILWIFQQSLLSEEGFLNLRDCFSQVGVKAILWFILVGLFYHLFAGIRHLIMDLGWGETKVGGLRFAKVTLGIAIIWAIILGVWLW